MRKHRRPSFHHQSGDAKRLGLVNARAFVTSQQYDALLAVCERRGCSLKDLLGKQLSIAISSLLSSPQEKPMPKFKVIEAQEVTRIVIWEYEVEAEDAEAAKDKAMDGMAEHGPHEKQSYGDSEYGQSGWATVSAEASLEAQYEAMQEAVDNITTTLP